eukprot:1122931_1
MGNAAEAEQQARQKEKKEAAQKARDERHQNQLDQKDKEIAEMNQKAKKTKSETESKAKKKKHKEQDNNNSVRLTIFVSFLSLLASLALSDTFGWGNTANGTVAILMSLLSMAITFIKLYINTKAKSDISDVDSDEIQNLKATVLDFNKILEHESNAVASYHPSKSILETYSELVYEKNELFLEKR